MNPTNAEAIVNDGDIEDDGDLIPYVVNKKGRHCKFLGVLEGSVLSQVLMLIPLHINNIPFFQFQAIKDQKKISTAIDVVSLLTGKVLDRLISDVTILKVPVKRRIDFNVNSDCDITGV